jgi:hypothetical protein
VTRAEIFNEIMPGSPAIQQSKTSGPVQSQCAVSRKSVQDSLMARDGRFHFVVAVWNAKAAESKKPILTSITHTKF